MRRAAIRFVSAAVVILASLATAGWLGGYRVNFTPSYPLGLWRIEVLERNAVAGDLVFICLPPTPQITIAFERGYIRRGLCPGWFSPLIKTVVATERQSVDIGGHVSIDGHPLAHSKVRKHDAEGRALPRWPGGTVPRGYLYLHSDFAGSFDSRYFGPVPTSGLLGLAHPVLTIDP